MEFPDWLEHRIGEMFAEWLNSDDGFPDGGSGDGLHYTSYDMQAAYRAGYEQRRTED